MATTFPALKARMGELDYFVAICTAGEAARTIQYVEELDGWNSETPPALKLQRKLNIQRVEREMVPYLIENPDRFYSALTVEVRPAPDALSDQPPITFQSREAFPGGIEFGVVVLDGSESLYALDGQHRLKSLELAVRQQPQLAREQIALILVPFNNISSSQGLFSDLNRYARPPSKSISLLFTHREALARVAKSQCDRIPLLRDRVNMETTTLSRSAKQFITLSTLYEMTKSLLNIAPAAEFDENAAVEELIEVWTVLTNSVPQWKMVSENAEHPAYLRPVYLNMHGVCQQAIAVAVARVRSEHASWRQKVHKYFSSVDWRTTSPVWQGVALHGGRIHNTSTSIRNLAGLLMVEMGVTPDSETIGTLVRIFEQHKTPLPAAMKLAVARQGRN